MPNSKGFEMGIAQECQNLSLEQKLNKLIKKGWKPRNKEEVKRLNYHTLYREVVSLEFDNYTLGVSYSIRDLVSKESGLWQFVCENHLYIYKMGENKNFIQDHFKNEYNECCYQYLWDKSCYEYYLLESALRKEEYLEKFLLENIKIS